MILTKLIKMATVPDQIYKSWDIHGDERKPEQLELPGTSDPGRATHTEIANFWAELRAQIEEGSKVTSIIDTETEDTWLN
tara:strand:+ start:337 stop:576 length:240 start_codon:yes stop_codon:yes gene_type:complete